MFLFRSAVYNEFILKQNKYILLRLQMPKVPFTTQCAKPSLMHNEPFFIHVVLSLPLASLADVLKFCYLHS